MRKALKYSPLLIVLLCVAIYFLSGFYTLQSGQHALILKFGKVTDRVTQSGVHYHLPTPFESALKTHVANVQTLPIQNAEYGNQERFTGDENLIVVKAAVSYDVKNLGLYLFSTNDIKKFIRSTGQMCLSQELAKMTVDDAMTTGKAILRLTVKQKMQGILDGMNTGVHIISLELTDITPPAKVSSAFKAVSDARVKKQEIIKDAEGYANTVIPKARGKAASLLSSAQAYSEEVIHKAQAKSSSFNSLLAEYQKNPHIIKNQKFIESLETIFMKATINIDSNSSQSVYYINEKPMGKEPVVKR